MDVEGSRLDVHLRRCVVTAASAGIVESELNSRDSTRITIVAASWTRLCRFDDFATIKDIVHDYQSTLDLETVIRYGDVSAAAAWRRRQRSSRPIVLVS